jgi:hypothetical protein
MTQVAKQEVPKAEPQAAPPAALKPLPLKPLPPSARGLKEYVTRSHAVTWPAGVPFEEVHNPDFWANVASELRQGDSIDIHWANGSAFAELFVQEILTAGAAKTKSGAIIGVLRHIKFARMERAKQDPLHETKFLGPNRGWGVVRIDDQTVMVSDLPDRETAETHRLSMRA